MVIRQTCSGWLRGIGIWQFWPSPQKHWPSLRLFWLLPSRHSFSFNGSKSPAVKISGNPCCCFLELSIMVRGFWRQAASSRRRAQFADQQRPVLKILWSLGAGRLLTISQSPVGNYVFTQLKAAINQPWVPSLTCTDTHAAGSPKLSPTLGGRVAEARWCWNPTPFPSQPLSFAIPASPALGTSICSLMVRIIWQTLSQAVKNKSSSC